MDRQGMLAAACLDAALQRMSAGVAERRRALAPDIHAKFSFEELAHEAQQRLKLLAEALAVGSRALFLHDVAWLQVTYASHDLPAPFLRCGLEALEAELTAALPDSLHAIVREWFESAFSQVDSPMACTPSPLESAGAERTLLARLLGALLEARREAAQHLLSSARSEGHSLGYLHDHVIAKALVEIGWMWQRGEIHVATEHAATRILEDCLVMLRAQETVPPAGPRKILLAAIAGNLHDIGLRMLADRLALEGWQSLLLGANTPTDAILQAAAEHTPDVLALSVRANNLRECARLIEKAGAHTARPILVGGSIFAIDPLISSAIGASAAATTVAEALTQAATLALGKDCRSEQA